MDSGGGIDAAHEAFRHGYRRRLLAALAGTDGAESEDSLAVLSGDPGSDIVELELRHIHLPKLAGSGYIRWDRETGEISKGPNWREIEPMVRQFRESGTEQQQDRP